ncbi:MAG TPA: hypothetical protein PL188_10835 [Candidatus Cloacimonadota bacterium]|nr:hypothetical protein [Candidatus Cloacimonadota bacterium]
MKHPYTGILATLNPIKDQILQVTIYQDLLGKFGCVIILEHDPDHLLTKLAAMVKYIRSKRLMLPLIIDRRFLKYSLDSYPLEFINIISSTRTDLMTIEDLLGDLKFEPADVRLQMEREFKSKWLLTRQVVLEGALSPKMMRETLHLSIEALVPAFKGFFLLANHPYPQTLNDLIAQAALISKCDLGNLPIWYKEKSIHAGDIERYLGILQKLMELMETYPV